MAPVEALAHSKIWPELMINPELDGAGIQQPILVTCRVASDIECVARSVRMNHKRGYSSRYYAQIRVGGRNDIAQIRITNWYRISSGVAARPWSNHCRRSRIEYLTC